MKRLAALLPLLLSCVSPDAPGAFEAYLDRTSDARAAVSSDTGAAAAEIPAEALTGSWLLAMSTTIDADLPLLFAMDVAVEPGASRGTLTIQSLASDFEAGGETPREGARTPVGDTVVVPDVALVDGRFEIALDEVTLPAEANLIIALPIRVVASMSGAVMRRAEEIVLCGTLSGKVLSPLPLDLAGSTFGAIQADDFTSAEVLAGCP